MRGKIFLINYEHIWPVTGGGPKYLLTNVLYLFQNYNNIVILQGIGSEADIPKELRNNVRLCGICNSARKKSKAISLVLFYIWIFKNIITNHNKRNVVITVGTPLTFIGFIAKLMKNKWINFLDDPSLNLLLSKKPNTKSRILLIFLKISNFADTSILINKDETTKFSTYFNIPANKIFDIPPVYHSGAEENKVFAAKLSEEFGTDKIILFYGDVTYGQQNKDAVNYIKNVIAPKFKGIEIKCKFVFAGKGTEKFENDDICVFMGFLAESELFTLIKRSYLVIAPILEKYESGIKTKIVNAISLGTPVLSTPSGIYGLEKDDLPIFVSSINDFPDKLMKLVSNGDIVERMRKQVASYVEKFYSKKVMQKWNQIIDV